jgi:uncharacterized protein (TIGR02001 family)
MRNLRILGALALLTAAGVANAQVSSTWTLTNDYDFRGISQSATDPALQGSVDFAAESGWYIGAWASNVDFGDDVDVDYEVDLYTGFSGGEEGGLGWDVGLVYYAYPDDSDLNYPEIFGALSYEWFEGKLWYSNDYVNSGESAMYAEANGSFPLPNNFSILAHVGYSFGDAWDLLGDAVNEEVFAETGVNPGFDGEYMDYSIGVGYTVGNFELALKYVDTDSDIEITDDVSNNEGRVIFTVATTFPWGED